MHSTHTQSHFCDGCMIVIAHRISCAGVKMSNCSFCRIYAFAETKCAKINWSKEPCPTVIDNREQTGHRKMFSPTPTPPTSDHSRDFEYHYYMRKIVSKSICVYDVCVALRDVRNDLFLAQVLFASRRRNIYIHSNNNTYCMCHIM